MLDAPAADDPAIADGHHLARGAAANTLVLVAANFRGIFTFLIARLLGEAAIGRFGLAFLTAEILSKAGALGLDSAVVPLVARRVAEGDGEGARRVFRRAIVLAAAVSAALTVIAALTLPWAFRLAGSNAFTRGGAVMMLALPGIAIARISFGASRALFSMRNEFYARGLTETWVTTGVFLGAVALGARDSAPSVAVVAGVSASAAVALALAWRGLRSLRTAGTVHPLPALLRFSLPTAGSNLLNVLVTQADVLLLLFYVGHAPGVTVERVGIFWVATEIAVGLRKVRQVFDPIFAPVVATRAVSSARDGLRRTVAGPGRWVLAAQLPLVGSLVLSGGAILSIYGPGFREGALWLALLGVAHGTNAFAGLVETLLMVERPGLNLINAAVTIAIQLLSGVILIPRLGITGAAIAMCLGFAIQGVLRFAEVRHVYGWSWPWSSLARPAVAFTIAFVPAVLVRAFTSGLAMEVGSGLCFLLLYAAAWWAIGAEPADREVWARLRSTTQMRAG